MIWRADSRQHGMSTSWNYPKLLMRMFNAQPAEQKYHPRSPKQQIHHLCSPPLSSRRSYQPLMALECPLHHLLQPIPQGKKSLNTDRNIPKPVTLQHVATGCPGQPFCSKPLSVPLPRQIASYPPLPGAKSAVTLSWLRMVENGISNDSLGHEFWEYLISVNINLLGTI